MDEITLRPIATVKNARVTFEDSDWDAVESAIEMRPETAAGLDGLETFSHVVVVFWMHEDPGEPLTMKRRPRGRDDMPMLGVFAQRGRLRPNPIGVTTAAIVRVEPARLVVRGLDAIDGTPVLDLKPVLVEFLPRTPVRQPAWCGELMREYWRSG